jgi:GNAT superfamily N-acetyltransferase
MGPGRRRSFRLVAATSNDAVEIAALRNAAAEALTRRYGKGHWSSTASEKGVRYDLRTSTVWVVRSRGRIIATLRLATRKPWAIDTSYFTPCIRPLYLTSMAVAPGRQGAGVGRRCLEQALGIARDWPADVIRLDAYDAEAGAGEFYRKCGFREVGRTSYKGNPLVYFETPVPE